MIETAIKNIFEVLMGIITSLPLILLFLLILTAIVCIHELGHFLAAKKFGVKVEEFSIGMGPLLYKWGKGETQYSIRAFPIGGYVKMLGEGESNDNPRSYSIAKPWKRLIIIFAGVFMNFVLVAVIFTGLAIASGGTFIGGRFNPNYNYPFGDNKSSKIGVGSLEEGSPAQKAGLKSLDVIIKVNDIDYNGVAEYKSIIDKNLGKEIKLEVAPYLGGVKKNVNVIPRTKEELKEGQGPIGFYILGGDASFIRAQFDGFSFPFAGVLQTYNATDNYVNTLGTIFKQAFDKKDIQPLADSVSSPVGTYAVTKKVIDLNGFAGLMTITALISLAIGFMNAIPFPALDGWHGLFIIFEMIFKKRPNEKLYNTITFLGFVLLLALGIIIMIKDVLNYNKLFG
ncbi:MAG: M50 family metallopeptidase [bacterium]